MKPTILIVDDNDLVRDMLSKSLSAHGYDVQVAANGLEALARIEDHEFDVVVSDILMPEKDGLEVIIELRKSRPQLPVIAISAPGNAMFLESARGLGAARIFEKPFEVRDLVTAIEQVLANQPAR